MARIRLTLLLLGLVAFPANQATAQETKLDPAEMARRIDQGIAEKYQGAQPAPLADDAEFLRRVYLDLAGRIPRVSEVREFLDDKNPDKRRRVVEELLEGPQYVAHFSTTWRNTLIQTSNQQFQFFAQGFKSWLDKQVKENVAYDQMVRELLTVPMQGTPSPRGFIGQPQGLSPAAFYQANEFKAENIASSVTRLFLGVRLECAQCHDHPFAKWRKDQFWETAAFFSGVSQGRVFQPGKQPVVMKQPGREILIPGTKKTVQAKFLDGQNPAWRDGVDARLILADWVTSPANPYFARMGANRIWGHFFGLGLIDPVDDEPSDDNPVSHPELLTELSRQFVAHQFDVKYLIRAITYSQTYQRTSAQTHESQKDLRLFARVAVRGLTPEQLFDSLAAATGYVDNRPAGDARSVVLGLNNSPRAEFLNRFASQERRTETQTSILQALGLMNGKFIADATSLERSTTLGAVIDAPFLNNDQRIETLFLAALSRPPRPEERQRFVQYVNGGGPRNDSRAALADVFWVLLNSSEFILNH